MPSCADDRERERLQRRQLVEQLVDLERAHDAAAHALVRREPGDVVAVEPDRAGGRLEHAGQQVDQRRLAGAVRADQRVARAASRRVSDTSLVGVMPPKRFSRPRVSRTIVAHRSACRTRSTGRISRSRPTSTSTTRNRPSQKVQYCGVQADDQVVQQLEDDGAEDAAVQVAGAADHQHQQHVGAAVEVEHVERREAGGLRQQRAGRAGDRRGERVDRDQPRVDRQADARRAQPVVAQRLQRVAERRVHQAPADQQRRRSARPACRRRRCGRARSNSKRRRRQQRAHHDALQAVGAAGQPVELVGEFVEDRARRRA